MGQGDLAMSFEEVEVLTVAQQVHGCSFKKRAPKAIKEIKAFATKSMVRLQSPIRHEYRANSIDALRRDPTETIANVDFVYRVPPMSASTHS